MLNMLLQRLLLLSTIALSALASPTQLQQDQAAVDWDKFHSLLDEVDNSAIRSALYELAPKFKEGVFSKDRTAIEQVHSENPAVASRLLNLARRQSNATTTSSTTTSDAVSSTTTSAQPSSTTTSAAASTTTTTSAAASSTTTGSTTSEAASSTTTSAASTTTSAAASSTKTTASDAAASSSSASIASSISSVLSSDITASTKPPVTTIVVAPTAPASATAVETISNAVVYSTYGGGLVTVTSSADLVSFTPSTSTHLFYTTLGNGNVQTSTAVVVVNAPVTTEVAGVSGTAGAAATSAGAPGLQNGASTVQPGFVGQVAAVLIGVVALAMFAL